VGNLTSDNENLLMKDWEPDCMKSDCQAVSHLFRRSLCAPVI
jgi:hypothetical protein